jgi:RHS repeat-associated protein
MSGISDKALKSNYAENKYRYNGKELQHQEFSDGTGLEEYDFASRLQDPQLGIWHSVDPLADENRRWSCYTYAMDNPIRFVDPEGMDTYEYGDWTWQKSWTTFYNGGSFDDGNGGSNGGDDGDPNNNGKGQNIYIIVKESSTENRLFDRSNGINQGAWHIIVSSSIEEANKALGAYLDHDAADNIVISAHGGTAGGSAELNEKSPKAVGAATVQGFINNTLSAADAKMSEDVAALKSVMSKLTDGGNFIITGCQAGLGERGKAFGESLVELAGCRDINVFLNQDLSQQKYVYRGNEVPTGFASIVHYTKENGWGITGREYFHDGWLKFTPTEDARKVGVLQLNTVAKPYVNYNKNYPQ